MNIFSAPLDHIVVGQCTAAIILKRDLFLNQFTPNASSYWTEILTQSTSSLINSELYGPDVCLLISLARILDVGPFWTKIKYYSRRNRILILFKKKIASKVIWIVLTSYYLYTQSCFIAPENKRDSIFYLFLKISFMLMQSNKIGEIQTYPMFKVLSQVKLLERSLRK